MKIDFKNPELMLRDMSNLDIDEAMLIEQDVHDFPWSRSILEGCMRPNYHNMVYTFSNDILGYGIMSLVAGEAHVLNLCIKKKMQGNGLGRRLLEGLIGEAAKNDTDTVFLEVRESNKLAIHLYDSMGFNEIGRRYGYYPAKKGKEDALVLALSL